ncbi:MAG: hypothetical protein ACRDNO_06705 [Trebonia sp.]
MLADLVVIASLLVAVAATFAWLALVVSGLSRAEETRYLPRGVWVLLCLFSPVGAVVYLVVYLAVRGAWRRAPRRGG